MNNVLEVDNCDNYIWPFITTFTKKKQKKLTFIALSYAHIAPHAAAGVVRIKSSVLTLIY